MFEAKEKRPVNWQRLGQGLVALFLVCCLVVNVSPVKAKAVEPVTMVAVSAATVIASVMIGIGVMMGQNREVFDQVVQMVQGSNALKDFIQKDETNTEVIPLYRSPGNGGVSSGPLSLLVAGSLIEAIRQVLFEEEVVSVSSVPDKFALYNGHLLPALSNYQRPSSSYYAPRSAYQIICLLESGSCNLWSFDDQRYLNDDGCLCTYSGNSGILPWYQFYSSVSYWNYIGLYNLSVSLPVHGIDAYGKEIEIIWSSYDLYDESGNLFMSGSEPVTSDISVSDGLTAGNIAPQEQELSEGYSDWTANSQWDVNNSQWWPVAVAPTYDETVTFTQEQVQKGEGTYIIADAPVYNINLPVSGSVTYERFTPAQPLAVSASVTDGGTISYEWFRYQTEPTLGGSESVGEGPSIVPETTNTGTWVYYCKATNTISGVSSLPVTSNYCNVTVIDPNGEENPDISPTEAPGVDPDPGGDSAPDATPEVDPDNQTDVENSGNQNVDDLIDVIPDHSEEFGNVLKTLADSMSYEGTEAILTIPQVNFPALGNLVPGFVMMEEQQVNFADYVNMMPENLLLLVRSLLTCALIMYCFYELYSTVNYSLTLKEG